ncbi:granulocyte colony-stimulating factor receptor [Hyperolius riggenbachi]|uniref:granulocyte colony-stimulating factor receptor n=1 Tax=Hyperolius riggenbachi TaxID=752182 RepID=UPI0035A288C4
MKKDRHLLMLEVIVPLLLIEGAHSCRIIIESPIIHLGSPLLASCSSRCPQFGSGTVVWKLDGDVVPDIQYQNAEENISSIYFSSFNKTSGLLQCYVSSNEELQMVDQIYIRAGYPPALPTNLSCFLNLTEYVVVCSWLPGKDSFLPTNVTLSSSRSMDQCVIPTRSEFTCTPVMAQNSCNISRKYFQTTKSLTVWVTAQNELGSVTSSPICVIPLRDVKLDPIVIDETTARGDSVKLRFTYGRKAEFLKDVRCQLRYRAEFETEWSEPVDIPVGLKETSQGGLLYATQYYFQIRCIRKSLTGQWSEWGPSRSQITAESAPTGKVETWWKMLETAENVWDDSPMVQLFWKPLNKAEANAKHLWYIVKESSDLLQSDTLLCNTTALNCTFSLSNEMKSAFIWTYNTAGPSPVKEIFFTIVTGASLHSLHVSPYDDYSLKAEWVPQTSATAYVLEWCKSVQLPNCEIQWNTEFKGCNTSILHDNIEPLKMYTVRLYPIYENDVGIPIETEAYSKEAAPDFSPNLIISHVSKSRAELHWKPIPLDRRNGFINNYTIFWIDTHGKEHFTAVDSSVTKFEMKNLLPFTTYQVFLRSSTAGGSVNGTVIMLYTTILDTADITLIFLIFSLFCFVVTIYVFIVCVKKNERMKNRLWPVIPDPAKSLMGKWNAFLEETPRMVMNPHNVAQILTSEITIVEEWQGKKTTESNTKDTTVSSYILASNQQAPSSTDTGKKWKPYVNADTVQYAQVIVGGYREQSPQKSLYVRSDSTQPLLGDLSPSPQNYENMWFHCGPQEGNVFLEEQESLTDFPLLHALQMHENGESFHVYD